MASDDDDYTTDVPVKFTGLIVGVCQELLVPGDKSVHTLPEFCCQHHQIAPTWQHNMPDNKVYGAYMGPTWGPHGADRAQVGPMLAPWTLLFGMMLRAHDDSCGLTHLCLSTWLTFQRHNPIEYLSISNEIEIYFGECSLSFLMVIGQNWLS